MVVSGQLFAFPVCVQFQHRFRWRAAEQGPCGTPSILHTCTCCCGSKMTVWGETIMCDAKWDINLTYLLEGTETIRRKKYMKRSDFVSTFPCCDTVRQPRCTPWLQRAHGSDFNTLALMPAHSPSLSLSLPDPSRWLNLRLRRFADRFCLRLSFLVFAKFPNTFYEICSSSMESSYVK